MTFVGRIQLQPGQERPTLQGRQARYYDAHYDVLLIFLDKICHEKSEYCLSSHDNEFYQTVFLMKCKY